MKIQKPSDMPRWHKITSHAKARGVHVQLGFNTTTTAYRYMSAKDFRLMMASCKFFMNKVQRWTDPYEKWWCEKLFRKGSRLNNVRAYGSCWTLRNKNEPFWRLHQNRCTHTDATGKLLPADEPPVRINTTVSKIIDMLSNEIDKIEAKAFIGNVYYCRTAAIESKALKLLTTGDEAAREAATGLHLKRYGFWYEKEIRALWVDRHDDMDFRLIQFNPLDLIEGVMIGPTLDVPAAKRLKAEITAMGIPHNRIRRSLIYRAPTV